MLKFIPFNSIKTLSLINRCYFSQSTQIKREFVEPFKTKFELVGKEQVNHNCYIFNFKFDGPKFSLKDGQHFKITETFPTPKHPEGQEVSKHYSPISTIQEFQQGNIKALIKVYRPQLPNYLGGRLGNYLQKLKIGDKINVEGPLGKFTYTAPGRVEVCSDYLSTTKKVADVKRIFFIAAGTGLAPIYQTLLKIVNNPNDKTEVVLLFCNRAEHDIFLRKQLEAMQPRIKLVHMLDTPPTNWKGLTGRVNPEVLNSVFPLNDSETFYVSCGPSAFSSAMKKIFQQYSDSKYFKI